MAHCCYSRRRKRSRWRVRRVSVINDSPRLNDQTFYFSSFLLYFKCTQSGSIIPNIWNIDFSQCTSHRPDGTVTKSISQKTVLFQPINYNFYIKQHTSITFSNHLNYKDKHKTPEIQSGEIAPCTLLVSLHQQPTFPAPLLAYFHTHPSNSFAYILLLRNTVNFIISYPTVFNFHAVFVE